MAKELDKWESRLKPFFESHLRIIGEIPISETELDELIESVRKFLGNYDKFAKATQALTKRYPFSFLTLLAHFSAHNDQQGYWQALQKRVGAEQDLHIQKWHESFVALAQEQELRVFSAADTPNYYVASIRFHGGIPTYSLPDFFERMVVPAVEDRNLRELQPRDALSYLLKHVIFVDKPVLDFLENSGEMGLSWFEACCKLVRHARANHGEVLPFSEVPELPYYIYAFFEQFNEGLQDHGFRWSRPYLEVSRFSEESPIVLQLPAQIVPLDIANQDLQWSVNWPELERPIIRPCEIVHRRIGETTLDDSLSIPYPTNQITISISSGSQDEIEDNELRRWTIPLLPSGDQAPLIAFRQNNRHLTNVQTLPAQTLYLLIPCKTEFEVDGLAEKVDTFTGFSSEWKNWKLEEWDLTGAVSLLLHQDGVEMGNIIPVAREVALPELSGGHCFDYQEFPDEPLYTSEIPSISIPVAANDSMYQGLLGWKLHLASVWETAPKIDRQVNLVDYCKECIIVGERAHFPLSVILGEKPAGIYDLKISGPKKIKAEFRVRLWPKLLLRNYSNELPEPVQSRDPVSFNIHLQDSAWVEPQPGAEPVDISEEENGFKIIAPPTVRRVQLELVTLSSDGIEIRVPVSIPIARISWDIAEENSPVKFSQKVEHISKERFAQYQTSAIHVEMHGLSEMINKLCCQLVEVEDEDIVLQEAKFLRTGFSPDWLRVSLKQFSETIQVVNAPTQFQLVYQKDWKSPQIRYALLEVSPQIAVENVNLQQIGECDWKLTWEEDLPLKQRRVMIKSAWQPWQPVIELKIPDENRGELDITELALPPSRYEVFFYIRRKWEPPLTEPPYDGTCHQVDLATPEKRINVINEDAKDHDLAFRNCIEKACILDSLGDTKHRDILISKAALHLKHLQNVRTLVESIKWMRSLDTGSPYFNYFRKAMFRPELVETILNRYSKDDVHLTTYLKMIDQNIYSDSASILLEEVDDPHVISTCIQVLINREDEKLVQIVYSMLKEGRLAVDDAADLLMKNAKKQSWAMGEISSLPQNSISDNLLATMLPTYLDGDIEINEDWLFEALMRIVKIEKSPGLLINWFEILLTVDYPGAWLELLRQEKQEHIDVQDFYDLLKINPGKAMTILQRDNDPGRYTEIIHEIEQEDPQAAGILEPGMAMRTPFGQAQIIKINLADGTETQKVYKSDGDFILYMVGGEGMDKVEVEMDFRDMTLFFKGAPQVFCCNICNAFCHSSNTKLDEHRRQAHPFVSSSLRILKGKIPFTSDQLSYEVQSN